MISSNKSTLMFNSDKICQLHNLYYDINLQHTVTQEITSNGQNDIHSVIKYLAILVRLTCLKKLPMYARNTVHLLQDTASSSSIESAHTFLLRLKIAGSYTRTVCSVNSKICSQNGKKRTLTVFA